MVYLSTYTFFFSHSLPISSYIWYDIFLLTCFMIGLLKTQEETRKDIKTIKRGTVTPRKKSIPFIR